MNRSLATTMLSRLEKHLPGHYSVQRNFSGVKVRTSERLLDTRACTTRSVVLAGGRLRDQLGEEPHAIARGARLAFRVA